MRPALLRLFIAVSGILFISGPLSAQSCFNTGLNGTVINLPCNQNCVNVPIRVPHLKMTTNYLVGSIPYTPYSYTTPAGTEDPDLYDDDTYSNLVNLPFSFCFFDSAFSNVVVGSNGLVTFDELRAAEPNAYPITQPIPYAGGAPGSIFPAYYPRASIMGAYSDLDPRPGPTDPVVASPSDRKIEWRVEGTAPCRRFIVSFYHIGVFSNPTCGLATPTTFQIVIYESTGLIEVFFENKLCNPSTGSNAILGIQNWARTIGIAAPGKNATVWTASNEGYRFTPSGGASRFLRSEVFALGGTVPLATGDTTTTVPGMLDITFPTFCPTGTGGQYVVKTTFKVCGNTDDELASYDTITINKTNSLNATATTTQTSCGVSGTGTATVTIPAGIGTAPYTFVMNPGAVTFTGNSPQQFTGLTVGSYNIVVTDASAGCTSTIPVTITTTGQLAVTYNVVNTSCVGAANGSITVNPPNGTPPITYSINGGPATTNNVFPNLLPGTYFISTYDNASCAKVLDPVTVAQGPPITLTYTTTPSSCPGANNGTITINPSGTPPYQYAINGGPYQSGNTFTGLQGGATYFIDVRDAVGCTITFFPVTVPQGTSTVTGTATGTNTSCAGVNNGSITVTPTSGVGPYQYSLNGGAYQAGATFSGLAPGTYTIRIREAGLCVSSPITVDIVAGSGLTATLTPSSTSCTGVNNGSLTVTPTNGTGPFTFVLDGTTTQTGATSTTFNGLAAGSHSVTITDASGCVTTAALTSNITTGAGFTATYTSVNSSCTGVNNGSITVTPGAGGTGPYTFVLDGTTTQTGAANTTFTGVGAGTHSVIITDAAGCQFTLNNATVTASAGFTATYTATNSSCTGASNGSLTVTPGTGGTGPYTFVLDGTVTQTGATSATFNGVTSGTHTVLITDAVGCQYTLNNATVNASTGFTATYTSTTTSCSGAANGSITVTPGTGSTGPYTFVLGAVTQTGAANTTFTGLAVGSYSVLITDAAGCQYTLVNAAVTSGPALTATVTPVATACPGVNNGSITVTPNNGNGPYTFVLDGTTTQTGAANTVFTGVSAGSHAITVTDVNGCTSALPPVTVGSGTGITANVNPVSTSCIGATNGSIAITPTNGTGPYTFVLNGTTTQNGATTTSFTNLAVGTAYSIAVTDAIGCTGTFNNITVPQGSALLATTNVVNTSCNGASNGQIMVTPSNGGGPYTFVLNGTTTQNGAVNTIFTGLAATTYNVVVTDAAGCVSSAIPATVNPGPAITVTPSKSDATCFGSSTGSISVVSSANATAPIEFSLDNATWQTGTSFAGLSANTYTVYIRDAVGCTNTASITVGQPAQLAASAVLKSVLCNGQNNGGIKVNVTGGTSPYSYSLDNATFQSADSFSVTAGAYTVYIRDANNCTIQLNNITVTEPAVLTATRVTANATCDGGNDGTITLAPSGGTLPYQYAITGNIFQPGNVFNVAPGTYDVTVRDANGCTFPLTGVVVGLTNNLTLTPAIDPAPVCEGKGAQLQLTTNATQFAWTPAADLSSSTVINPVATPKTTTTYSVVATLGRCTITDDITVAVMPAPVPEAGINGDICFGQSYTLQPVGDPSFIYNWTPSSFLSSTTGYSIIASPDKTTTYTLSVTDNNGCTSLVTDNVTVNVTPPIQVRTFPMDTVVYAGAQVQLLATSAGTYYTWSPAAGLSDPAIANPVATAPMTEGAVVTYIVTTTTDAGCTGDNTVTIRVYKGPEIYVPNAFTPNGDGKNDRFIPFPVGIKQISYFRVFNRWGQMLYSTTTLNQGWDGTFGGMEQASGVYVWMVEGVTMDNQKITKKGTVTLIR
ncbi:MAG: gliding motility-associated C-terminal domain-containing protein [Chitinophagaceae bacterium]|nr:gliding motility-associated C-terminal domain-containing protein [Chitinophagaceae bacterium]